MLHTPSEPSILHREFIYAQAPFPSCHASTIAETRNGLLPPGLAAREKAIPMSVSGWPVMSMDLERPGRSR